MEQRSTKCEACGKEFFNSKRPHQRFCSRPCKNSDALGAGTKNYKGHISQDERGYLRYSDNHPLHPKRYVHNVLWFEANPDGSCSRCGQKAELVHHINEDKSDNRSGNLEGMCRACHLLLHHHSAESHKVRESAKFSSRYRGVCDSYGKWRVTIQNRYIGTFPTEKEAALVYDRAALERYGEFALTNRSLYPEDF